MNTKCVWFKGPVFKNVSPNEMFIVLSTWAEKRLDNLNPEVEILYINFKESARANEVLATIQEANSRGWKIEGTCWAENNSMITFIKK